MNQSSKIAQSLALLIDLEVLDYKQAWDIQHELHRRRVDDEIPDILILVEHPPVITVGKSGKDSNLLISEEALKDKGIELYRVERGGDATFHGPGQLVGYPIFKLYSGLAGVRPLVRGIEAALIKVLEGFGIDSRTEPGYPGVWVGNDKIAAIGLAVRRWVSFHGFALNVTTDLSYFRFIVPCGLKDRGVTSIKELLGEEVPISTVKQAIMESFETVFSLKFERKGLYELIP
jgi:lipoyl(octanoyl) transferase